MFLCLCFNNGAWAQSVVIHLNGIKVDKLEPGDFSSFYRDSRGYLWTNTNNHLYLLEGRAFKKYPFPNTESKEFITGKIGEEANGDLVFSTNNLLFRYDYARDVIVNDTALHINSSDIVLIDHNWAMGTLFFDNQKGVIAYKDAKEQKTSERCTLPNFHHFKAVYPQNGQQPMGVCGWYSASSNNPGLWFSWFGAGKILRQESLFSQPSSDGTPPLHIHDVLIENEHKIWIAAREGLFWFDPTLPASLVRKFDVVDVRGIVKRKNGEYWIYTANQGLWNFRNHERLNAVTTNEMSGFTPTKLNTMYLDHEEILWLSFEGEGIAYSALSMAKFLTINVKKHLLPNGQNAGPITAAVGTPNGNILVGTEGTGLLEWLSNKNTLEQVPLSSSSFDPSQRIFHLFIDAAQRAWVVTKKNIYMRAPGAAHFKHMKCTNYAPEKKPHLFYLIEDAKRRLWVTSFGGIFELKPSNIQDEYELISAPVANCPLGILTNGFAHADGIFLNSDYDKVIFLSNTGSNCNTIPVAYAEAFCANNASSVWMGTSKGLVGYDTRTGQTSTPPLGIYEWPNDISNLASDRPGRVWASSPEALHSFDFEHNIYNTYTTRNGINGDAFVKNTMFLTPKKEVVVANSESLFMLTPTAAMATDSNKPYLYFKNLWINDQPLRQNLNVNLVQRLQLPFDSNTVAFEFVGIDFFALDSVHLQYRLDGLDKPDVWVSLEAGAVGFSRYPNLPHGRYKFQVRTLDHVVFKEIDIIIAPPFYKTWWFATLSILTILGLAYSGYRYRMAQLLREKTLEQEKQTAELNALRAFINPHFLFNALNSINAFILTKKTHTANEYLADFSKLMRQMFDHAQNALVSIQEELDLIESYIKVEQRRFQQPFEYEINISPNLDTYNYLVPSMMMQPFVENSIWHGLQHRQVPGGKITIHIALDNKCLITSIEDNGVGRTKAAEIKQRQRATHRSQGLHITRLRIEQTDKINSVQTIDLYDDQGNASGTKVVIRTNRDLG